MEKRKSIKHYVTNIISFANSRSKNNYHDRSMILFAGAVTPELTQLMTDVWQPIVGENKEIIVIRSVKSKKDTNLGISIEGFAIKSDDPDATDSLRPSVDHEFCSNVPNETRHFVQALLPDSLFWKLNSLKVGDEILQVNGYRIHGRTHNDVVRCLRSLPTYIELVISRSIEGPGFASSIAKVYAAQPNPDDTLYVAASDVCSVATGRSVDLGGLQYTDEYITQTSTLGRYLPGAQSPRHKVSEWVERSRSEPTVAKSFNHERLSVLSRSVPASDDMSSKPLNESLHPSSSGDYLYNSLNKFQLDPNSVDSSSSNERWKPTWSRVPLVVMLNRDFSGFGFSFNEYENADVFDPNVIEDVSRSFSEYSRKTSGYSRSVKRRSSTLAFSRTSSFTDQNEEIASKSKKNRGVLLINNIIPGGCVHCDGRLSFGDRLLFVNDRKLAHATRSEAARFLQYAPMGLTMIGVAKMKMIRVSHYTNTAESTSSQNPKESEPSVPPVSQHPASVHEDFSASDYQHDHPLDYYTETVSPVMYEYLHTPSLVIPPLQSEVELSVKVALDIPLGMRLDARAAGGVDGCRVTCVLRGGAVDRSMCIFTGDYVTGINDHPLRFVTNTVAFDILRRVSSECSEVVISYFPSSMVTQHRFQYFASLNNGIETQNNIRKNDELTSAIPSTIHVANESPRFVKAYDMVTTTPLMFSSEELEVRPWIHKIEVKLARLNGEVDWGLRLTGPDLWPVDSHNSHLPFPRSIPRPTIISCVLPDSAAARCDLLNPGDIIIGVNGLDASSASCKTTSRWIQCTCYPDKNQTNSSILPPIVLDDWSVLYLLILPIGNRKGFSKKLQCDLSSITSPYLNSNSIIEVLNGTDHPKNDAIDSSDSLIRDNLANSNEEFSMEEPTSVEHEKTTLPPISNHLNGHIPDTRNIITQSDLNNLNVSPSRSLEKIQTCSNLPFSDSATSLASLTKTYRRLDQPDDEIHTLSVRIYQEEDSYCTPFSSTLSGYVGCEYLGLILVGNCDKNKRGNFISDIRPNSIVSLTLGLKASDELVQVNNTCLVGISHISAGLLIAKEAEALQIMLSSLPYHSTEPKFCNLHFVVRRNESFNSSNMKKASPNSKNNIDILSEKIKPSYYLSTINCRKEGTEIEFFEVEISKKNSEFGLCLVNVNSAGEEGVFVNDFEQTNNSALNGHIKLWDRIISVNGCKLKDYDHALKILTHCADKALLTLARSKKEIMLSAIDEYQVSVTSRLLLPKSFSPHDFPTPILPGIETLVEFVKGDTDFGISIVIVQSNNQNEFLIRTIQTNSLADQDGRLKSGDYLLAINEFDLHNVDAETANKLLLSTRDRTLLKIYRDAGVVDGLNSLETFEICLDKQNDQNFGLVLKANTGFSGTAISDTLKNSPASMNAEIRTDDLILEVNKRDVRSLSCSAVINLLKQCPLTVFLKLGRLKKDIISESDNRLRLFTVVLLSSTSRLNNSESAPSNEAVFGLSLRNATQQDLIDAPGHFIVDHVFPDSSAYRSSMVQVGDHLLGVDREPVDWLSLEEFRLFCRNLDSITCEFGRFPSAYTKSLAKDGIPISISSQVISDNYALPSLKESVTVDTNMDSLTDEDTEDDDLVGNRVHVRQLHLPFAELPSNRIGWRENEFERPRLGISIISAHGACGPKVMTVTPGSPAHTAGLLVGDRILGLDDRLLVTFGGQDSAKVLNAIEETWLSRTSEKPNSRVILTVITTAPKPPRRSRSAIISSIPTVDSGYGSIPHFSPKMNQVSMFGCIPGGINYQDRINSQKCREKTQRRWPKDVGDNLDVHLQAAPPGLISALTAGEIAATASWQGEIGVEPYEVFRPPGEREVCPIDTNTRDNDDLREKETQDADESVVYEPFSPDLDLAEDCTKCVDISTDVLSCTADEQATDVQCDHSEVSDSFVPEPQ